MVQMIWGWILSNWLNVLTGAKAATDAIKGIEDIIPKNLQTKELAQAQITEAIQILDNPNKTYEEKRWEIESRKEMVNSLIDATEVEAKYNIARYAIYTTFVAFIFHTLTKSFLRMRRHID